MNRQSAAFSLMEMVGAISLLAVFLLAAGRLVLQTQTIHSEAASMEWAVSRMDHALRQLRDDVWHAAELESSDQSMLSLTDGRGRLIHWTFNPEPSTRWPERGFVIRESEDGSARYETPVAVAWGSAQPHGVEARVGGQSLWLCRAAGWIAEGVTRP